MTADKPGEWVEIAQFSQCVAWQLIDPESFNASGYAIWPPVSCGGRLVAMVIWFTRENCCRTIELFENKHFGQVGG